MAATIAHEVNNPLEAVTNLIYLAKSNAENPDEVRKFLSSAESEVARVSHIAKQTLGFYQQYPYAALIGMTTYCCWNSGFMLSGTRSPAEFESFKDSRIAPLSPTVRRNSTR
jgi:hypothetical protein